MRKWLCALLALGMTLGVAVVSACGSDGAGVGMSAVSSPMESGSENSDVESDESSNVDSDVSSEDTSDTSSDADDSSSEEEIFVPDYSSEEELTEYFAEKTGEVTYNTGKDLTIESVAMDTPIYLGGYSEDNVFTVDGGPYSERKLTVVGAGGGVVQAYGGVLVFRNLTIENNTHGFEMNEYRKYYAEFGGKVRFENCKIDCSIQLRNDAEAEFINCEIKSVATDQYSVWVADGSARFDGCTFTGYRALKVHEINGMDVINVTVENCVFESISVKPAIAIDIAEETSTTAITFTGCDIYNCGPWAQDSLEGVDGFYESDQDTTSFDFSATACYLDNALFDFCDGEMIFAV
ncbi:MAG: hypothetical protein E7352_06920 [Clostridiales bacterium]|nr:hypothetical protein [Clostridiales bacterium]